MVKASLSSLRGDHTIHMASTNTHSISLRHISFDLDYIQTSTSKATISNPSSKQEALLIYSRSALLSLTMADIDLGIRMHVRDRGRLREWSIWHETDHPRMNTKALDDQDLPSTGVAKTPPMSRLLERTAGSSTEEQEIGRLILETIHPLSSCEDVTSASKMIIRLQESLPLLMFSIFLFGRNGSIYKWLWALVVALTDYSSNS